MPARHRAVLDTNQNEEKEMELQGINLKASNGNVITIGNPTTVRDQAVADRIESYLASRGYKTKTEFAASAAGALEAASHVKSIIDLISSDETLPKSRREADVEYLASVRREAQHRARRLF